MSVNKNDSINMLKEMKTSFACFSITLLHAGTFMVGTIDHQYMCDIKSGEGRVITNDKIREPRGMCASSNGCVFVCSDSDSIVQLSLRGDVLMAHDVGMYRPCAISVSTDGSRLVVSNGAVGQSKMKLFNIVY